MRTTATCPKCSCKKIVVAELRIPPPGKTGMAQSIPALVCNVWAGAVAGLTGHKCAGGFESWICTACGYTEFYAKDLGDVVRLAAERPRDVRVVDATNASQGPFR